MPIDGGNLILSAEEGKTLLTEHPETAPFIKYFKGSEELMKSSWRYCFYLLTQDRAQWEQIPVIMQHVAACRAYREAAPKSGDAYKLKDKPWSFREQFNPPSALVIPRVSSERRYYVPMDFIDDKTIINDRCFILPNAETFHFGILTSRLHMCWMKLTCGRLKSDYNYSRDLVYNTFIWPAVTPEQKQEIAALAEDCLLVREDHFEMTLAELYNPETMPAALKQAHEKLDLAVERLYREKPFISDEERTMFMLNLYAKAAAKEQSAK